MKEVLNFESKNIEDTLKLGKQLGNLAETGQIILLSGELGSGKTIVVKGIAEALNINKKSITSPTYTIINEYKGKLPLYHMDLYRLEFEEELIEIGFEEYLYREGIIAIEWPEIALALLPADYLYIKLEIVNSQARNIKIKAQGNKGKRLQEGLEKYVNSRT